MLVSGPGKSPASPIHPHRARWANRSSKNTWNIPSWTGLTLPSPKSDRDVRKLCVTPSLTPPWLVLNAPVIRRCERKSRVPPPTRAAFAGCVGLSQLQTFILWAWPSRSSQGYTRTFGALTEDPIGPKIQEIQENDAHRPNSSNSVIHSRLAAWPCTHTHTHTRAQCRSTPRRNFTHESRRVIQMSSRPESGVASRSGTSVKGCLGLQGLVRQNSRWTSAVCIWFSEESPCRAE